MRNKTVLTLVILFILIANFDGFSQDIRAEHDQDGVREVIDRLFKGMHLGDSALARSTFSKDVTTATIFKNKTGEIVLHHENSIADFMKAIAAPHKDVWHEEIWDLKIQLDGDFAQAWCDYAFYSGNNFSHCGVDAFHLYRSSEGWKIFHLADTRRKTECTIPKDIQDKHR